MAQYNFKSERRERQRRREAQGMQVSNTSIRTLARLSGSHPTARNVDPLTGRDNPESWRQDPLTGEWHS